jgi:hypothetical protein
VPSGLMRRWKSSSVSSSVLYIIDTCDDVMRGTDPEETHFQPGETAAYRSASSLGRLLALQAID